MSEAERRRMLSLVAAGEGPLRRVLARHFSAFMASLSGDGEAGDGEDGDGPSLRSEERGGPPFALKKSRLER